MTSTKIRSLVLAAAAVLGLAGSGSALAYPGAVHGVAHVGGWGHGGWGHGGWGRGWYGGWRGYYPGWGFFGAGLFLSTLPWYYSTYYWDGVPYYYADNVYYRWNGTARRYESVAPPEGRPASQAAPVTELFMYPKGGQSTEQQAKDRYECHRWAADQTGFDPTQPSGGVAADAAAGKRADYLRAEGACLEGRNYSVR